jgi:hypothetical protein
MKRTASAVGSPEISPRLRDARRCSDRLRVGTRIEVRRSASQVPPEAGRFLGRQLADPCRAIQSHARERWDFALICALTSSNHGTWPCSRSRAHENPDVHDHRCTLRRPACYRERVVRSQRWTDTSRRLLGGYRATGPAATGGCRNGNSRPLPMARETWKGCAALSGCRLGTGGYRDPTSGGPGPLRPTFSLQSAASSLA